MIPVYKEKDDIKSYGNCRSFKLLDHGMKVIERIFEKQLMRIGMKTNEMQMEFMPLENGSVAQSVRVPNSSRKID